MAPRVGRKALFEWDGSEIAGVREKSAACNGEPVDVSDGSSDGWRELLDDDAGENQVNISLSGVTKSAVLKDAWFSGQRTQVASLTYPDGGVLSGTFYLASYSESEPYKEAATFEAEIQSSGPVTYTGGAAPSNTVLPAISGTPQVGVPLRALKGEWIGAVSFGYQWKNDGTDIGGATASTYTPVVGDVGDPLSVVVTAINSAGSTNATSGPSADVLAA